jgi:hypothetical protein
VDHLGEISIEELQDVLDNVGEVEPAERLLSVIAYKNGSPQTELDEGKTLSSGRFTAG